MNFKKIIFLIPFLFIFNWGNAQEDTTSFNVNHKITISASAGITMPLGAFGTFEHISNNFSDASGNIAGAAKSGSDIGLQASYSLSNSFQLIGLFYYSINKPSTPNDTDLGVIGSPAGQAMGGGYYYTSYTYTTETWYASDFLIGFNMSLIGMNTISLKLKFAGGLQQIKSPKSALNENGIVWEMSRPNIYFTSNYFQPQLISRNFIFDGGLDFDACLTRKINLTIDLDFLMSQSHFKGNMTNDYNDGTGTTEAQIPINFLKSTSLLLFNIGASYAIK